MNKKTVIVTLIICCVLAVTASYIASSHPDGLEWAAHKLGFLEKGEDAEVMTSPMPDYELPPVKNRIVSAAVAAAAGTVVVFGVVYIIMRVLKGRKKKG